MYSRFRGQRLPIDYFLASLAQDQRQFAIGIIFSGTGNSWTLTLAFKPKLQRHYVRPNSVNLDVVVTDYNMPGLSGLDIARQVREVR